MSNKLRSARDVNPLTDSWKPETQEIVIMFTFNPYARENEESFTAVKILQNYAELDVY